MVNITLTPSQFTTIADLLTADIEDIANHPEFFEECGYDPKNYIDERIALCQLFNVDFWNMADLMCNHYVYARLKALYEGQPLKEFTETYEMPSQNEIEKGFARALIKGHENLKTDKTK